MLPERTGRKRKKGPERGRRGNPKPAPDLGAAERKGDRGVFFCERSAIS